MAKYEVIVGNIGTVYSGDDETEAHKTYDEYREQSQEGYGRAVGEPVTLLEDGEYVKDYWPVPHSDACPGCAKLRLTSHRTSQPRRFQVSRYCVVVGNIGTVYDGDDDIEAHKTWATYVKQSQAGTGRAAGEEVVMFKDDDMFRSYYPEDDHDLSN
jgi:hypothetical protein